MRGAPHGSTGQRGYAMAVLLVTLAVLGVAISVAVPVWRTIVQREKEEELIFRGRQYARAIALFQRRFANAYPPSFDVLVEQKFLRKKFKDPMTEDGEFEVLYQGSALALPGGTGLPSTTGGRQGASLLGQRGGSTAGGRQGGLLTTIEGRGGGLIISSGGRGGAGPLGGVIGVASKSTEKSFRVLDGRSQYNEWQFVALPTTLPARGSGVGQPGGVGGRGEPGGIGGRGPGAGQGRGRGGQGRGGLFGPPPQQGPGRGR